MAHYFSKQQNVQSEEMTLHYQFDGSMFKFISDHGVFSKNHVDDATDLLLKSLTLTSGKYALDLGCGYGVIGIVLSKHFGLDVTMVDVNERALDLSKRNTTLNDTKATIINSDGFENIEGAFDYIVTNPPIRIGKTLLYELFDQAISHLNQTGELWLVMHKKHGALSALKHLNTLSSAEVMTRKKGFHIIRAKKR